MIYDLVDGEIAHLAHDYRGIMGKYIGESNNYFANGKKYWLVINYNSQKNQVGLGVVPSKDMNTGKITFIKHYNELCDTFKEFKFSFFNTHRLKVHYAYKLSERFTSKDRKKEESDDDCKPHRGSNRAHVAYLNAGRDAKKDMKYVEKSLTAEGCMVLKPTFFRTETGEYIVNEEVEYTKLNFASIVLLMGQHSARTTEMMKYARENKKFCCWYNSKTHNMETLTGSEDTTGYKHLDPTYPRECPASVMVFKYKDTKDPQETTNGTTLM